jgi:hypothetical protein
MDLPACSMVPQPATLPRPPLTAVIVKISALRYDVVYFIAYLTTLCQYRVYTAPNDRITDS